MAINERNEDAVFLIYFAAATERVENDVTYSAESIGINKHGWLWNRLWGIN